MATYYMYFLFLTCKVKCGVAALDDRRYETDSGDRFDARHDEQRDSPLGRQSELSS
jgi:hypothetical protein